MSVIGDIPILIVQFFARQSLTKSENFIGTKDFNFLYAVLSDSKMR